MRKYLHLVLFLIFFSGCKQKEIQPTSTYFTRIDTENVITDNFNVRAILVDNKKIWYASDKGKYGFYDVVTKQKVQGTISNDSLNPEFRSIAQNSKYIFLINVGNPVLLYRIAKDGSEIKLVYQENTKGAFYDSMKFWNEKEGIAVGDPTEGCFSILITRDLGETWQKISCDKMPPTEVGEAAFASSNTNVVVNKNDTWIVSGGKKARIFYSPNKGKSWEVFNTPIVQGLPITGIFSADFYDGNIGFIVGGNYDKPDQNWGNKALTINGGKTWVLTNENAGFGYASCVQFVPNSGGKQLVTVGYSGINYSSDNGSTWKKFSDDKDFHTIRFLDNCTAVAAGKNKITIIKFKK